MGIKSIAKRMIYRIFSKEEEQIIQRTRDMDIISFDVFDTLLKRDVLEPDDVFVLMERKLQADGKPYAKDFAAFRKKAEQNAKAAQPDREITLKDIYSLIPFDASVCQELMNMECQMELSLSAPNIALFRVYENCLKQGKTILFISDMYLPANVVQGLLEKNGYTKGKLYVSSESGFTKKSGALFSYVKAQEKIDPKRWCHIGDHIISDFFLPKKMGIRSILIERNPRYNPYVDRKTYRRSAEYRQLNHFIDTRISRYTDPYEQIGYAVLGPILYGFSTWLEKEIPDDETIVFLAREGALLQKAFEIVSTRHSIYLCISRHAAMGAYLSQAKNYNEMSQVRLWTIKKGHSQKELALSYGLSDNEVQAIFQAAALDEEKKLTSIDMEMPVLKAIWPAAKQKAIRQHRLLERYLDQLGISKKSAAIDVGWRGTVLMLLNGANLMRDGEAMRWTGYYMGIHEKPDSSSYYEADIKAFLYDKDLDSFQIKVQNWIRSTIGFFEIMFLSTDGTTEHYDEDEFGNVYPVKGRPDNEQAWVIDRIKSIQNAGLQFVSNMNASQFHEIVKMDAVTSISNYLAFAHNISLSTLCSFRNFRTRNDDEGSSLINEHRLTYYMLHPRSFLTEFMKNECKVWFLKSVFKIPFPYITIINFVRKVFAWNRV